MRFKKPQSPYLSRVLTQKIKAKKNMFQRLQQMEELGDMSFYEDVWDKEVENGDSGVESGRKFQDNTWQWEPNLQRQDTWYKLIKEGKKNRILGDKMVDIIAQERKLWEEERKERKHLKNQEKWAKKLGKPPTEERTKASSRRGVSC
jgi:hypothetical protein